MTLTTEAPVIEEARVAHWRSYAPDMLVAATLVVIALLVRQHGLPTDGLWLDDSVTAAGLKASLWHLLTVGFDHPGFTAWLMAWSHLGAGSGRGLAYPALIAGTLGPGLLYLALRRFGYARSIAVLLGAALVVSQTDIVYSGRVKTYTLDALIVLAYALAVPRLARIRWRWQTGLLWVVAAILVASLSAFALVATAAAGLVLVLHPAADLRIRAVAVAVQEAAHVFFLSAGFGGRFSYDAGSLNTEWRRTWDAFVKFDPNPLRFGRDALRHLGRVAQAFPGGPGWFATLCAVAAIVGLVGISLRGRQQVRGRYLLLVLGIAFLGGVLGKFPFGPKQVNPFSSGERVSIWLAPVIALGLAGLLQGMRGLIVDRRRVTIAVDAVLYAAAATALVLGVAAQQLPYPFSGTRSATTFIESRLGPHDVVLVPWPDSTYSLAAESDFAVRMEPQPVFLDPRLQPLGTRGQLARAVLGADRVYVYLSDPQETLAQSQPNTGRASTLGNLGFEPQIMGFHDARVEVWQRGQPATYGLNLHLSDLPAGWQQDLVSSPYSTGLFACLHVPRAVTDQSVIDAKGGRPTNQLSIESEVTSWASVSALESTYNAVNGSDAARCVQSTLQSAFSSVGYRMSVTATVVPPPPGVSDRAVAFTETVRPSSQTTVVAEGKAIFFMNGTTSVLINSLSAGQPAFPDSLLSKVVATVANRVSSPRAAGH